MTDAQPREITLALMMFAATAGTEEDKMAAALNRVDRFRREGEEHAIERLEAKVAELQREVERLRAIVDPVTGSRG